MKIPSTVCDTLRTSLSMACHSIGVIKNEPSFDIILYKSTAIPCNVTITIKYNSELSPEDSVIYLDELSYIVRLTNVIKSMHIVCNYHDLEQYEAQGMTDDEYQELYCAMRDEILELILSRDVRKLRKYIESYAED